MLFSRFFVALSLVTLSIAQKEASIFSIVHSNGLTLSLNQKLEVERTSEGFRIRPLNFRKMRSPFELTIELSKTRPDGEWPSTRPTNGETIHYRIDQQSGGSGGTAGFLSAWKPCTKGYVLVRQRAQAEELNLPDYSVAWQVIADAGCTAAPDHP
jgi:Tse3 toxin immunity protein Tsi3